MPETVATDGPPAANRAATASASALALHLDCTRACIGKLEAEGVIQRQGETASRSTRAALPTCASSGNRRVVRPTLPTSRPKPRCCNCACGEEARADTPGGFR
jgi:hypothetical protein